MIIENFEPFIGQHCETTATGTLLKQLDIHLSEPLLFGIGEGLGYIFWNMKMMDFPFIGGRVKPDVLTENICRNLNLTLDVKETASTKKAWRNIAEPIEKGKAVGLKLDCYHLDYFTSKFHFAGHYTAFYGYDEEYAYLVDTDQQGRKAKTSLKNLALARSEKGPMSSKNLSYVISKNGTPMDLKKAIQIAIHRNAEDYLNPPIKNISYKGILKTSVEIVKWFKSSKDIKTDFQMTAILMEKAGTGGALFRNLYRDFLYESYDLLGKETLKEVADKFAQIAEKWTQVSDLFFKVGETKQIEYIHEAAMILVELSKAEKEAMTQLYQLKF